MKEKIIFKESAFHFLQGQITWEVRFTDGNSRHGTMKATVYCNGVSVAKFSPRAGHANKTTALLLIQNSMS